MTLAEMKERAFLFEGRTHESIHDEILELAQIEAGNWKPMLADIMRRGDPVAGSNSFFQDTRPPFSTAVFPTVTLATTSKMLVRANPDTMVQPTEWWPGKKLMLRAFGKFTTAATPGNLTIEMRAASSDAGGTLLATSAAAALIASKTDFSWRYEGRISCFSTGNGGVSGSLLSTGIFECNVGLIAAGQLFIPETGPAAVTVDLTAAVGISLQMKRSGSTAETATITDQEFVHLN